MSLPRLPLLLCGALVALSGIGRAQIVINEFQYDDSSTDDREFVELYNSGSVAVDISGWQLLAHDENTPNASYTVQAGTILAPGAFWVMGSSNVPNVNQIVGTTDLWQNDMETLELWDPTLTILFDSLVYETNKALFPRPTFCEGQGLWGNLQSNDGLETSWSRIRDGYDTNNNGNDFRVAPQTPGATNNLPSALPYFDNFDTYAIGSNVPGWGGSFKYAHVIDPTIVDIQNPNVIAASPVGGNAAIFWDSTGGGNANMFLTDATDSVVFETYIYVDATPRPVGEYETWSILLQGGTATFHNHPDPTGEIQTNLNTTPITANGNVGVGFVFTVTQNGGTLYLMDHNDGGWGVNAVNGPRVLGQISVTQGVNDGWQRLRLQCANGLVEGYFGGTYGQFDGSRLSGAVDGKIGGIGIGYREFMVNNAATRPLTLDFVSIRDNNAVVQYFANATPGSTGTPKLAAASMPLVGNSAFGLKITDGKPLSPALLMIGFAQMQPPTNLTFIGAQTGSTLEVTPDLGVSLLTDGSGAASMPLGLPATPSLVGASLYFEAFVVDTGLPNPLPIAQTRSIHVVVGN